MNYKYVYIDDMVKTEDTNPKGELCFSLSVKNRQYFKNCPIEYNAETGTAFIFSNELIPELGNPVDTNRTPSKSHLTKADVEKLPVSMKVI